MNAFLLFISRLWARRGSYPGSDDRRGGSRWQKLLSARSEFFGTGLEDGEALIHISITCRRVSSHCARQVFPSGGFAQWAPSQLEAGLSQVRLFFCLEVFRFPTASEPQSRQFPADDHGNFGRPLPRQPYCTAKMECGWPKMAKTSPKTDRSKRFLQCSHANLSLHLFAVRDYMLFVTRTNNVSR
ncbi:hypothetical protein [Phyllobacterium phragmitis]|uniref:hypothetical protein n=1 Tax=Phyllobacterium phragmitis TaxID=2670329 RepID=UPI0011B26B77|nr:hypothetical protein [Phyllobacterium phragmitis]